MNVPAPRVSADDLAARYPSVLGGEREWLAVLRADDGLCAAILGSVARASARPITATQLNVLRIWGQVGSVTKPARMLGMASNATYGVLERARFALGCDSNGAAYVRARDAGMFDALKVAA